MRRYWPEIAWGVFAAANLGLMFVTPGWETVPFHFIWISLTLLYGVRVWPWRPTIVVLAVVMAATTIGELHPGLDHPVEVPELAEVVLMALVFLAMVWYAQRRQAALEETARAADREREFLQDASHQLRTPITIARGHAELIRRAASADEVREDADVVIDELGRLSTMSDRLLMLAAAGHADFLFPEPTRLDTLVRQAADRWRPCAERDWSVEAGDPILVSADPGRLGVAIDAVVENAVQHTASGDRILLRARSDRRGARIEVADSGPGIPPEALGPIFNRFSRAPGVRRGTGLGLPMTRAIMEAHGGSAHVESADGRGTTVALSLPTAG